MHRTGPVLVCLITARFRPGGVGAVPTNAPGSELTRPRVSIVRSTMWVVPANLVNVVITMKSTNGIASLIEDAIGSLLSAGIAIGGQAIRRSL